MDPHYWDGVDVHFQAKGGDHHAMTMACDLILSTWAGPHARSGSSTEDRVGYTFERIKLVTCPKCREWMESNLKRCDRCGDLCCYGTCSDCLDVCVCGTLLLGSGPEHMDPGKWQRFENHTTKCPGRQLAPKKPVQPKT